MEDGLFQKHEQISKDMRFWWRETLGKRGWIIVALGKLCLFFVRHPRFLGGNRTELTPGGCTGWEDCQASAVNLGIWHQIQNPVGKIQLCMQRMTWSCPTNTFMSEYFIIENKQTNKQTNKHKKDNLDKDIPKKNTTKEKMLVRLVSLDINQLLNWNR